MKGIRLKALLAVLIPVLVMAGWLAKLCYDRDSGLKITLPIRGYDPRDLLSGHYLRFQIDYGPGQGCDRSKIPTTYIRSPFCVCAHADETSPIYWSGACSDKPDSCEYYIEGTCDYSGFNAGIERFYISERLSHEGVTLGKEAKVRLSIPRHGRALVLGLIF